MTRQRTASPSAWGWPFRRRGDLESARGQEVFDTLQTTLGARHYLLDGPLFVGAGATLIWGEQGDPKQSYGDWRSYENTSSFLRLGGRAEVGLQGRVDGWLFEVGGGVEATGDGAYPIMSGGVGYLF